MFLNHRIDMYLESRAAVLGGLHKSYRSRSFITAFFTII